MNEDPLTGDAYGVPERLFGFLTPELPAAIGRIVMLSALLESKIAALASSVENKEQAFYAANDVSDNCRIIHSRVELYRRNPSEETFARAAQEATADSTSLLDARNKIVHRVWPKAGVDGWGGWKPLRKNQRENLVEWTEWTNYTEPDMKRLIRELIANLERYPDLIASAGSFERR